MRRDTIDEQIQNITVRMDNQENQEPDTKTPSDEIQDIYVLIVRERQEEEVPIQVIDITPIRSQKTSLLPAYTVCGLYLLCILSCIAFQVYAILNPPIATMTIIPKSQTVTLTGTLQLGRLLQPLTISQSQTTATTGKGHQDAKAATGTLTFYNGQQTGQTVAPGTIFTGNDGVSIETTQSATISPGNPNTGYGTVTVTAQALQAGSRGNIQAGDVNTPIALAVFVKNNQFKGGQDKRSFSTVSTQDIHKISTPLKSTVAQSMHGAQQDQLQPDELLQLLPCTQQVISDHQPGDEATQVKVTVSRTCSAAAYNREDVERKATDFLSHLATTKLGTDFSLLADVHVSVKQATITHTSTPLVFLTFEAQGTWVYALGSMEQQHIKTLIAGKSAQEAIQLVTSLPGIEHVTLRISGIGDPASVPKYTQYIHLVLKVV